MSKIIPFIKEFIENYAGQYNAVRKKSTNRIMYDAVKSL